MIRASALRFGTDTHGAAALEFAMLAPLVIGMLLGVFQIGLHANNYSSLRSVMSDADRYASVEYQREHELTLTELRAGIYARAVAPPYNLAADRPDVEVIELDSEIGDAKKFSISLSYAPPDFLKILKIDPLTIRYSRPAYVRKVRVVP